MKENQIARYILQHDARNLQLKRRLAERGIDWRNQYDVLCRFHAVDQPQASLLADELYKRGFLDVTLAPAPGKNVDHLWRVEAKLRQSINRSASHEFTEEMVRTAAALSCIYDGWEASPGR